jgi:hypothetical protein
MLAGSCPKLSRQPIKSHNFCNRIHALSVQSRVGWTTEILKVAGERMVVRGHPTAVQFVTGVSRFQRVRCTIRWCLLEK